MFKTGFTVLGSIVSRILVKMKKLSPDIFQEGKIGQLMCFSVLNSNVESEISVLKEIKVAD